MSLVFDTESKSRRRKADRKRRACSNSPCGRSSRTVFTVHMRNSRAYQRTTRGGRVRIWQKTDYRPISKKGTGAPQLSRWSFLLPQGPDLPKNCCQTFEGRRLYARRPVVCVHHDQTDTARLQRCREHHNWTEQMQLFSDESRFSLSSDCRRQLIWRESGTAYRPKIYRKRTDNHGVDRHHDQWPHAPRCVANGTIRANDTLMKFYVRLFRGAVGDKFVFMNTTQHVIEHFVQDCLDSEGIQRLVWPAAFPD
ncbi:hypothetical protein TNCV_4228821 [Trichonephila clavipes]|nr:hypothetical protein TNCV_4228821 [Trichonephila clavipes]